MPKSVAKHRNYVQINVIMQWNELFYSNLLSGSIEATESRLFLMGLAKWGKRGRFVSLPVVNMRKRRMLFAARTIFWRRFSEKISTLSGLFVH